MCGFSFLRNSRLYHSRLLFIVESGTGIGTANHLPLTGEPQKVVRTAEAGEECPYVSVRTSRIGIYGHTSFARLRFIHAFSLFPLSVFHFVESGIGIGTANHLPLTSEPQKAVCTAEAEEECPYVSVRASRIGIYGHTSFVGLRLVHAFKRFSKLEYVFFSHAVPHLGDVPFNLPLVTLTSILRLPDVASGGHSRSAAKVTPGFAGNARSSLLFCEKNLQPYG